MYIDLSVILWGASCFVLGVVLGIVFTDDEWREHRDRMEKTSASDTPTAEPRRDKQ